MAETYISNGALKIADGDIRAPGDPIPEAGTWSWQLREQYIRAGRIRVATTVPAPRAPAISKEK